MLYDQKHQAPDHSRQNEKDDSEESFLPPGSIRAKHHDFLPLRKHKMNSLDNTCKLPENAEILHIDKT